MPDQTPLPFDREKHCNHFELRLEEGVAQGKHLPGGKITLYSEIWVDGRHIDEPRFIDLPLLVQSLHEQRWFEIFTCGCGIGGCAGVVDVIRKLIKQHFIKTRTKRNFLVTTNSKHSLPVAPDLVQRRFNPEAPNRVSSGDKTYTATDEGWAAVMDLFSRQMVGWRMQVQKATSLVM